ncbi:hypothetical protein pdam_00000183 [Pocillopora damicornis]|uniref:Uncharacterized protein n=1 Tax=Pocillopora damicornis TaxID=46731 RepID=A0A3M6UX58_POCDA|nr:hypothetical protein pdam_00000183 [Pocillopora damicornis]
MSITVRLISLSVQKYKTGFKDEFRKTNTPAMFQMIALQFDIPSINAKVKFTIHEDMINERTRFKVTICLYLSLNSKAKSLSVLIRVIVLIDCPHNTALVM